MPAFSVSKSIEINAPRERVYEVVRDFQTWPTWSPWLIAEPGCKVVYAEDGKSYDWEGTIVGAGEMSIAEEKSPDFIHYNLAFRKPWNSEADVKISFREAGEGKTEVTWGMDSKLPIFLFFMKGMMTAMIGMDYQRGLNMLKDLIETGSVPSRLDFKTGEVKGFDYVGIRSTCSIPEIGPSMEADMVKLGDWLKNSGEEAVGPPFAIYHKWDIAKGRAAYTIGFPVTDRLAEPGEGFVSNSIPDVRTYTVTHTGPYRHLGNAWSAGMAHQQAKVFAKSKTVEPFEIYENDPTLVDEKELITSVHFPLKA